MMKNQSFPKLIPNILAAAMLAVWSLAGIAKAGDTIVIDGAYARATSPKSPTGAVFMTIGNTGAQDLYLIGVRSEVAKRVELHTHKESDNGVMRMMQIEGGIVIPAGGDHRLKRGGDHVMLMGLTQGLEQGEQISLTLIFETAGEMTIDVTVDHTRKPGD